MSVAFVVEAAHSCWATSLAYVYLRLQFVHSDICDVGFKEFVNFLSPPLLAACVTKSLVNSLSPHLVELVDFQLSTIGSVG